MGGISQCPACGDLNYGDERDDYQTCACHTGATVMSDQERIPLTLTREQAKHLEDQLEDSIAEHANAVEVEQRPDTDWRAVRVRMLRPIYAQLRAQDAGEGE